MGKFFGDFADSGFGSWAIAGAAAMAFFIAVKVLVARFPDSGFLGALKAGVNFA